MPWNKLRPGLLQDMGYESPEQFAEAIGYTYINHLGQALAGKVIPADDLMSAILRAFPVIPAMYFVERNKKEAAA